MAGDIYGRQLALELQRQGRTQAWLAQQCDVSAVQVNHWVRGRQAVPATRRKQVEAVLGWVPETLPVEEVDVVDVIGGSLAPMAFLLQQEVPEAVQPKSLQWREVHPVQSEGHLRYSLRRWARYLNLHEEYLLAVVRGEQYLDEWRLALVFKTGVEFTYLGEHLGEEVSEREAVKEALRDLAYGGEWGDLGPDTFDAALAALELAKAQSRLRGVNPVEGRQRAIEILREAGGKLPTAADEAYLLTKEMWHGQSGS